MTKKITKTTETEKTERAIISEIYEFKTDSEAISLSAQRCKCTITDKDGERQTPDEICLLVSGESEEYGNAECPLLLSLSEAKKLGMTLLRISN